jgi:glycosyltransferase involved in cell wall biosynthesis
MKVLLSAYACGPDRGSEPGIGWNCVRQVARFHEVWVVTWAEQRPAIDRALSLHPLPNVHFVYVDSIRWGSLGRLGWRGERVSYYAWQIAAWLVARRLHRREGFDIIHHVTLGGFWYPTFLPLLRVPFVWGPVGTGLPSPKAFHGEFSLRGRAGEWARWVAVAVSRLDPIRRQIEGRASAILAVSPLTVQQLRPKNRRKAQLFSQVGVDRKEMTGLPDKKSNRGRFRVLSVGRLVHWKGFALGIKAFALFHERYPNSEYRIIGDGPERAKLARLVSSAGLSGAVHFPGWLSRSDYLGELARGDVLVYPGLHEPGAYVIAEAMAAQLPVICLDFGEPASIVTHETGIKIPVSDPERVVAAISEACAGLAAHPSLCDHMGDAGRQRILGLFEWDEKGRTLADIYEHVVRGRHPTTC